MGKQKEKVKASSFILAQELFSNQCCPECGTYIAINSVEVVEGKALLNVLCLNEECIYVGERELI